MKRGGPLLLVGLAAVAVYVWFVMLGGGGKSAQSGAGKAKGDAGKAIGGALDQAKNHAPKDPNQMYDGLAHYLAMPWVKYGIALAIVGGCCAWLWKRPRVLLAVAALLALAWVGWVQSLKHG